MKPGALRLGRPFKHEEREALRTLSFKCDDETYIKLMELVEQYRHSMRETSPRSAIIRLAFLEFWKSHHVKEPVL